MIRLLYTCLFYLALPIIFLKLLWRSRKAPHYKKRLNERFALKLPSFQKNGIWIHAVSVGETIATAPIVKALLRDHPELPITITCMTPTGSERIRAFFGDQVQHCYLPYDTPYFTKRFLKKLQPKLAIIMETELWPNCINQCHKRKIPVILANGRLSERSAKGYARFSSLTNPMMASLAWIATQTQVEAQRFIELGAKPENVTVTGSIKFDINIDLNLLKQAADQRQKWHTTQRPTWIAASTHDGEDKIILEAHRQLLAQFPNSLLILVPRHPERFEDVYKLCSTYFTTVKRSDNKDVTEQTQILLGDTMGELLFLYALADAAFVGGSLIPNGGHNILEPIALQKPVITGPHLFNFQEITNQLSQEGALTIVNNSQELFLQVKHLFESDHSHRVLAGNKVIQKNQGALELLIEGINTYV